MPMLRKFVPFGELMPDQPAYRTATRVAQNAYPRSRGPKGEISYGPWPAPTVFSDALDARCQGAFTARSLAGNVAIFAGDASKLYSLGTDAIWDDVGTGYTLSVEEHWEFCQFGEIVLTTDFTDVIQAWTLDSSAVFAALAGSPPRARHMAVIEPGFVMLGNLSTNVNAVQWCAYRDPTDWPTPGTSDAASKQSDLSVLPFGGWVQRLVGPVGGASGVIFCDSAIFRIEYAQPPVIFRFIPVVQGRGTPAPYSVVQVAISSSQTVAFFLSDDGLYAFDGTTAQPIGNSKVDRYLIDDMMTAGRTYIHRTYGFIDPTKKLVIWQIPTEANGNGARFLCFNWADGAFSELVPASLVGLGSEFACTLASQGYTLDGLDALGYTLDAFPFSFDSRVLTGGAPSPGFFDSNHKLNYFNGANLAATIGTTKIDGGNGRRLFCGGLRPIVDVSTTADLSAQVEYNNDQPSATGTLTSATTPGADYVCPQRISARYMAGRAKVAAGATWNHAAGIEATIRPEGLR